MVATENHFRALDRARVHVRHLPSEEEDTSPDLPIVTEGEGTPVGALLDETLTAHVRVHLALAPQFVGVRFCLLGEDHLAMNVEVQDMDEGDDRGQGATLCVRVARAPGHSHVLVPGHGQGRTHLIRDIPAVGAGLDHTVVEEGA